MSKKETAEKVADIWLEKLNISMVDEDVLEQFRKQVVDKLVQREPFAMLCEYAPDIFFYGLEGLEELTPYFLFKASVIIYWNTGKVKFCDFD